MPSLRDIRKRVRSVKSTQQITRAMKMVAAAKLRRAQETALAARPYATKMSEVLRSIASRADVSAHPLFQTPDSKRVVLVVVTADRGLCGGLNSNLARRAVEVERELRQAGKDPVLFCVGRKGRDFFRRRKFTVIKEKINVFAKLTYGDARILAKELVELFLAGETGEVRLVYNEFKSVIAPRIMVETLLPIPRPAADASQAAAVDYEYEPSPEGILEALVPWHVNTQIWRVLIESWAAEQGARMTAMESATKNAGEMIEKLTLTLNKARQASITREIIEVVSGAMALEG